MFSKPCPCIVPRDCTSACLVLKWTEHLQRKLGYGISIQACCEKEVTITEDILTGLLPFQTRNSGVSANRFLGRSWRGRSVVRAVCILSFCDKSVLSQPCLSSLDIHAQYSSLVADQCAYYVNKPLWHRIIALLVGRRNASFYRDVLHSYAEAHHGSSHNPHSSSPLSPFFRETLPEFWEKCRVREKISPQAARALSGEYKWPSYVKVKGPKLAFFCGN